MLRGVWDLPGPGVKPLSPALAGGFFTSEPPARPLSFSFVSTDKHAPKNVLVQPCMVRSSTTLCPPSCCPRSHHLGDCFKVTAASKSQPPSSSLPFRVETCLCYACVKVTEKVSQPCSFVWVDQATLKALETSACTHTHPPRHTYINQCIYIYIKIQFMYVNQSSDSSCLILIQSCLMSAPLFICRLF